MELCDLTVEVFRGEAMVQELDLVHPSLCAASAMIGVLARRNGRGSASGGNGLVVFASVEGAIGVRKLTAGDLLIGRDLVKQFGQHWRVAYVAGGELGSSDLQCLLADPDVDLAPRTAPGAAVLAGVPLPFLAALMAAIADIIVERRPNYATTGAAA